MNCLNRFHSNTFVVAAAAAIFLLNWAPRSAAPNARPHQQQQQLEPAVPNYCNDSQLMQQAGLIRAPMGTRNKLQIFNHLFLVYSFYLVFFQFEKAQFKNLLLVRHLIELILQLSIIDRYRST